MNVVSLSGAFMFRNLSILRIRPHAYDSGHSGTL